MAYANKVLNELKGNQSAFMYVDTIFQLCSDNNVKFIALQILDEAIKVSAHVVLSALLTLNRR